MMKQSSGDTQKGGENSQTKIDIGFKSIHQQVQEENEKKQQALSQGSRKSLFPDLEIDEKLLNLLRIESLYFYNFNQKIILKF